MQTVKWSPTGLGGTPNQADIDYFGFTRVMTHQYFRKLVPPGNSNPETVEFALNQMRQGQPIANPFLLVDWDEKQRVLRVRDHEGRSRADAAWKLNPDQLIPVHIFVYGIRARNLTPVIKAASFIQQPR